MIGKAALLLFPLLMAFAASSDLLTMRISNRLVLILAASFAVMALAINMPLQEFGLHLACAAVVLVVAFSMFGFGWIGGGDAKLAAATTLWLGFGITLPYLLYASLIGGFMTLALLGLRRWPLPLFQPSNRVPVSPGSGRAGSRISLRPAPATQRCTWTGLAGLRSASPPPPLTTASLSRPSSSAAPRCTSR